MRLKDKVVIVTGGGTGIGKTFCLGLAENGANVIIADIDIESAKKVASEIEKTGVKGLALFTDVSDENSTKEMADSYFTFCEYGRIRILLRIV